MGSHAGLDLTCQQSWEVESEAGIRDARGVLGCPGGGIVSWESWEEGGGGLINQRPEGGLIDQGGRPDADQINDLGGGLGCRSSGHS